MPESDGFLLELIKNINGGIEAIRGKMDADTAAMHKRLDTESAERYAQAIGVNARLEKLESTVDRLTADRENDRTGRVGYVMAAVGSFGALVGGLVLSVVNRLGPHAK